MTGISPQEIECGILTIRGQSLLVDARIADLYGVTTKEVNQVVSNNPNKFSPGYSLDLVKDEKPEVVKKFDHLANLKFSPYLREVFSEKGRYLSERRLKRGRMCALVIPGLLIS